MLHSVKCPDGATLDLIYKLSIQSVPEYRIAKLQNFQFSPVQPMIGKSGRLYIWGVRCSDVILAFDDAQFIPPFSGDETDDTDNEYDTYDTDDTDDQIIHMIQKIQMTF